jgi:hypothetical protein
MDMLLFSPIFLFLGRHIQNQRVYRYDLQFDAAIGAIHDLPFEGIV